MQIITRPSLIFKNENIEKLEDHYSAKFVCDTCVAGSNGGWVNRPTAVFYQSDASKVPEGGSQWLGLYRRHKNPLDFESPIHLYVCNAISTLAPFDGVVAKNGDVIYSRYRHDYRTSPDGSVWIDGGRDYLRYNGQDETVRLMIVKDKLEII